VQSKFDSAIRTELWRARPLPDAWRATIERNVPYTRLLPAADLDELHGHVQVFLAEKTFEGCRGMVVTDTVRLTIAAQACLLLLHRETDYYPLLDTILVYPSAFEVELEWSVDGHVHARTTDVRIGESWQRGIVVLSWQDVQDGAADIRDGHNVVLHEFAHQLDHEGGDDDGTPLLGDREQRAAWARVLGAAYEGLVQDVERGAETLLDPYASESPAEFFAVATEFFFEASVELRREQPELYEQLKRFYRQDPAELRLARPGADRCHTSQRRRYHRAGLPRRRRPRPAQ
jgi:hypothetical protein